MSSTLHQHCGYDYVAAMSELLKRYTYQEIADRLGYKSTGSIAAVLKGHKPSHPLGEAMWALYVETFNCKPPMTDSQRGGVQNNAKSLTHEIS